MYTEEEYNEFSNRMEETYPRMFSYPYGGFAIGQGWWHVVEKLCEEIHSYTKWKRNQRAYDLRLDRARDRGREAVLQFISQGKAPRPWDEQRADAIMATPPAIAPYVSHVVVHQIKEKFGGLRFYYVGGDAEISGMVRMAELWASDLCEDCGARGTRREGGWIRNLCDLHEAERQEKMKTYRSEDD